MDAIDVHGDLESEAPETEGSRDLAPAVPACTRFAASVYAKSGICVGAVVIFFANDLQSFSLCIRTI